MPLDDEELEELRESFRYNDFDEDGRIEFGEFLQMLEELEAEVGHEEARIGFAETDTDRDGTIDFEEFLGWWTS
jgi:Ca2+-binding EF-hand superfamily protein